MKKNFFSAQSELTEAKTKIFKEYITGYLPKLLMTYGKCMIADLFCGPGKNGKKNGSPLILIESLKYILSSEQLKKKNLTVYVLFNDEEKAYIENLQKELSAVEYDKKTISVIIKNEKYDDLLQEIVRMPEKQQIPKFIFLDPFSYSDVKMQHLINIMSLSIPEILLFIPIFHSYRFSSVEYKKEHKTRKFVEEFTTDGIKDYKNVEDFIFSVRRKILKETAIPYVRHVILDGGGSKNVLFLLTKHQAGMLLMNKVAFKNTNEGNKIITKTKGMDSIFSVNEVSSVYRDFSLGIEKQLKIRGLSNKKIVDFTIRNCFLPSHAKEVLTKLYSDGKIAVFDEFGKELSDKRKWNIAENITKTTIFKWI